MSAEIRIGASGWHYKHWLGSAYPPGLPASKMLAFYQQHFDTVEINNTFYRLPTEAAVNGWRDSTPDGFRFAAKGSRFITHMKKLKDPALALERYFSRVDLLGDKLGPVLWQLPPQFGINLERLADFLHALPHWHRHAFEFRDQSWNTPAVYDLLRRHNAAYCAFHLAGYESPTEITTDFTYIRLHGPGGKYQGSYDDRALGALAGRINDWKHHLNQIYVYFDNDDSGYAPHNALRLRELVLSAGT